MLFTSTSIGKCLKSLETNLVYFVLPQFHSKKAMSQCPCFDIEYWGSYGLFLSNKLQWNKIQSSFIVHHINYSNFFDFLYNNIPLGSNSTSSSTGHLDYSYARIYKRNVEELVVEIHHRRRHSFFSKFSLDTVVIHFVPGNFHFLTEPGFFCCGNS